MPLNARQQRFVDEYLVDRNITQAAKRAGYSAKTAYSQGQRLMKKVEISEAIIDAMQKQSERTGITSDRVLKLAYAHATADLRKLFAEDGTLLPPSEWPDDVALAVMGVDVKELYDTEGNMEAVIKKIKRTDPLKALKMVGDHVDIQAFRENVEVTHTTLAEKMQAARKRRQMVETENSED